MKQAVVVLVFAGASVWCGGTGWAQAQPDMAYYSGDNDGPVPPGTVPPSPEDFVGGVQRDPRDRQFHTITVAAKGDKCGRSFYIKGTFRFDDDLDPDAEITGTMSRCTTTILLPPPCNHLKNYQVEFKGTVKRGRGPRTGSRQLSIDINYFPDEKWIPEPPCKKARTDRGTDSLVLTEARPDKRTPTGKIINDDIEEAEKLIVDSIMKGFRKLK